MKRNIILSIIVPVYNVENYLDQCLESIIKAYNENIEVILVDDGSKDNSGKICDKYSDKYDFISVIHKENGGLSSARNTGISSAKGKYIWFVDSDDYISDSSILNILKASHKEPDLIIGNYLVFYPNGKKEVYQDFNIDDTKGILPYEYFNTLGNVSHAAVRFIVKRELIDIYNLRFMEGIYHEDEQWTPRVLCSMKSFELIKPTIYNYRVGNTTSIMGMVNPKKSYDKIVICKSLYDITKKESVSNSVIEYLNSRILHNYTAILNEYNQYSQEEKKKLSVILKENFYLIKDIKGKKANLIKIALKVFGLANTSKLLLLRNSIK